MSDVPETEDDVLRRAARALAELPPGSDEAKAAFGRLIEDYTRLTAAQSQMADQAETALSRLRETQEDLIQAEKSASLGDLVAGIAHEINTPLGIGLTAASYLDGRTVEIHQRLEGGTLRASDLKGFLNDAGESCRLILSNLNRAAKLVESFKRVAADQASEERRHFELAAYLDEIVLNMKPKLRHSPVKVVVRCPPGIEMDSYPGALAQVITNLIMNSLIHAFEPREAGTIVLEARMEGDWLDLTYADDGKGIAPQDLSRIFDPFFTTRRGQGGTGLGLHLVYSLVTRNLGGSIHVESQPRSGTSFIIRLPVYISLPHDSPVGTGSPAGAESDDGTERTIA